MYNKDNIDQLTMDFINNRDIVKNVFSFDNSYIYPVAANVFCNAGVAADEAKLRECKKIIKKNAGFASYIKSYAFAVIASKLCVSPDPEAQFRKIMDIYSIIKKHFSRSSYLALLSALLAERSSVDAAENIAQRGKKLYNMMKKDHPFLTSSEDSVMACFMALSDKDDNALICDAEECYKLLHKFFFSTNMVQASSHVLAVSDGAPEDKVRKMTGMFNDFKAKGRKFGSNYELPVLAALSAINDEPESVIDTVISIDTFLASQKGYKGVLGIDKKTRLMHSAILTADLYQDPDNAEAAASASTIALIAAQEAAICAAIAASAAASNSSN